MKKILLMSFLIVAFVACDKEDRDQSAVSGSNGNAVSISEATIAPIGNEAESERISFTVTSDVPWKIKNRPVWLVVSPIEGKAGTTQITMYAGINNQSAPYRQCALRIEANDGSFSETVDVFQERPYLEVSRESIDFRWDQCDVFNTSKETIVIRSNTDWRIEPSSAGRNSFSTLLPMDSTGGQVDWLVCSELQGTISKDDHVLYFNPATYNIEREPKTLELEICGALDSYKLTFTQTNLLFTVDIAGSDDDAHCEFAACNTDDASMTVESELAWRVEGKPDWLVVNPNNGITMTEVRFNIDGANPGADVRVGNLVLVSEAGTNPLPQRVIEIRQKGYILDVQPASVSIPNNDLTAKNVDIASSGSWAIDGTSIPEWLDVPVVSGAGSESGEPITVAANGRNYNLSERSANVEFHSTQAGNTMSKRIEVRQDRFVFDAGVSEPNIGTIQTSSHDLTIHSSGEWAIDVSYAGSPEADWLNIEQLQGEGDAVVKYNAKTGNVLDENRSAVITVRSLTHEAVGISGVEESISVIQRKYTFEVDPSPDRLILSYDAADEKSISIDVNCSADWSIECPAWLVPSRTSGSNYATVAFRAQNNLDYTVRSGKLVVKSTYMGKERSFSFDVTQSAFVFDDTSVEFSNLEALNAGTHTINIVCSGGWELRNCEPWIGASAAQGYGNTTITIRPQDNVDLTSRRLTFYVYSVLKGLRKSITVSQKPFVFDTRSTTVPAFAPVEPEPAQIALGECLSTWTVRDIPSWITVSPSAGSGSATLTITPRENLTTAPRSATIRVVSDRNSALFKEIAVSQSAFVFDTDAVAVPDFDAVAPESVEIAVGECTSGWSVIDAPDWLTIEPMSGTGAGRITLTPSENLTTAPRNAVFHIVSDKNSSLRKTVSVSQRGYIFDANPKNVNIAAVGTSTHTVNVDCSGRWSAECSEKWIHLVSSSGTGNGSLTFRADNNSSASVRTATIKISSLDGCDTVIDVVVSQASPYSN